MNLSVKRNLIVLLIILFFIPLEISRSLAVSFVTTENFISELKTRIKQVYQVNSEDIVIEWSDESLEKKITDLQKFYPNKTINIKVKDAIIKDISGRIGIPVDVYVDDKMNRILYLRCKVDILKEALVAKTNIKKGEVLIDELLKYTKLPINKTRNIQAIEKENVIGKVATSDILENSIITSNLLKERTVVFRGNQVTIRLRDGDLTLISVGQALQDGFIGQAIQVKLLNSTLSKIIMAKVIDVDLVEINLGGN